MTAILSYAAQARKALIALAAAVSAVVSLGVLHGTAQSYAVALSTFLGALLVYAAPNKPRKVNP